MRKLTASLHLRIKTNDNTFRYVPAVRNKNGSLREGYAIVGGQQEHHPEGIYAVRYTKSDGKRTYEAAGRSAQDALTLLRRMEVRMAGMTLDREEPLPRVQVAPKRKLQDAVTDFLSGAKLRNGKRTLKVYGSVLEHFVRTATKVNLEDLGRDDIIAFIGELQRNGLSPRTIHNRVCAVRAFIRRYDINGVVHKADLPRFTKKLAEAYSPTQLRSFFGACTPDQALLFRFFLQSGCREQEVMFSTYDDLDHDAGLLHIRAKLDLGWTLKDHEERSTPLPTELLRDLALRRQVRPKDRFLFPTANGQPDGHFLRQLKRIALRAGLNCGHCVSRTGQSCADHPCCRTWELHRFRRSYAFMHHEAGVSLRTLQDWLGHADIQTTQTYLQAADKRSARIRAAVDSSFAALSIA